ncbi:hypothetical protein [Petrimonas sulfuriphila]|uniref:hypothetical protein n=1 Tax=Petrimonas sulfuriphila TaxID=285070 RepID=UPI003EC076BC
MKENLMFGCLGNGTTVCDTNVTRNGDYKNVAHISDTGKITWYVKRISREARIIIENEAEKHIDNY